LAISCATGFSAPLSAPAARSGRRFDPFTDKPAAHPSRRGRFDPRLSRSDHLHRNAAQLGLHRGRQLAKIPFARQWQSSMAIRQQGNRMSAVRLRFGLINIS
jgi:hypothetical protein